MEKGGTGLRVPSEDEVRVIGRAWVAGSTLELFDIGMGYVKGSGQGADEQMPAGLQVRWW